MTTDPDHEKKIKAMARAIKQKVSGTGMVVLLRDHEGRAHLVPGHDVEIVAVYSDTAKTSWILHDLIDAGIQR